MGRQVCIRVTHGDLALLEDELRSRQARFVRYYQPDTGEPKLASTIDPEVTKEPMIWLTRDTDLPRVSVKPVRNQSYRLIDQFASPVMELSLAHRTPGPIREGRLYFQTARERVGAVSGDDHEFDAWGDGVLQWVRRRFSLDRSTECYEGPEARAGSALKT